MGTETSTATITEPVSTRAGHRAAWLWAAVVVACFCVPLFVGLGRADLANDEAIYSFSADVMVQSGEWLVPKASPREDMAFLEKPPLKFWIVAAPIKLGLLPRNEFGLRFWDALFGGVAFLYVFAIGRRLAGPLCGFTAVLVLFLHRPLLFEHGLRENNMEAALVLCYCGAMYHFLAWRSSPRKSEVRSPKSEVQSADMRRGRAHVVAIGLYFVLGFMCKFVAALFLPMLLTVAMLLRREDREHAMGGWRAWCGTALLVVALCAPWFAYVYYRMGPTLWKVMLGVHVVTRFTSSVDAAHLQPWNFYFSRLVTELQASHVAWLAIAGAILLLARAVGWKGSRGGDLASSADVFLLLLWFAAPLILISSGTSKLYHYIYPFLPPVALAAGYFVASFAGWVEAVLDRAWGEKLPGAIGRQGRLSSAARWFLVVMATACAALALVVLVLGHAKLVVGDALLLRTASPLRPLLVTFVALVFATRGRWAARVVVPLILLSVPLQAYRQNLALLDEADHPLRSLAACMQPIAARQATNGKGPGVYVETETIIHPLTFYMRALGPWRQLPDRSNAKVYETLYLKQQPVLLSRARQQEFDEALDTTWDDVVRQSAGMADVDVATAAKARWAVELRAMPFPADTLLLPGDYAGCASEKRRVVR